MRRLLVRTAELADRAVDANDVLGVTATTEGGANEAVK